MSAPAQNARSPAPVIRSARAPLVAPQSKAAASSSSSGAVQGVQGLGTIEGQEREFFDLVSLDEHGSPHIIV